MTREEQITQASQGRFPEWGEQQHALELAFQAGAIWADAHPYWISVEDELPKDRKSILFTDGGYVYSGRYYGGRYYGDSGDWVDFCEVATLIENITHWMPLPALPEHIADVGKMISSSELPNNRKGGEQ